MSVLWIVLAVMALGGAFLLFRSLSKVLGAARALQQHVDTLGEQVNAELKRLGGDLAQLGDELDQTRRRR